MPGDHVEIREEAVWISGAGLPAYVHVFEEEQEDLPTAARACRCGAEGHANPPRFIGVVLGLTVEEATEALAQFGRLGITLDGPEETPLGEDEIVPVDLDRCWRDGCGAEIGRDNEVGLCWPCQEVLRKL